MAFSCLLANAWPTAFSCQLDCWRRQQVFLRSQWFYNGRILYSTAPLPEKCARIQRRWLSDVLALWYDWGETQHRGCLRLGGDGVAEWRPLLRGQRLALDGLVDVGRRLLCAA
jgi:hypothetical protein